MEALGNPKDYAAFYVACKASQAHLVVTAIKVRKPKWWLVCAEFSRNSHTDVSGHHVHVLATLTDVQYRSIIQELKKAGLPLRGQARNGQARSYGKVKVVRDLLRMGAYTLKAHDQDAPLYTNFPDDLLNQMVMLSFQKEADDDHDSYSQIMEYITHNFPEKEERILKQQDSQQTSSYCTNMPIQEDTLIKECILDYFLLKKDTMKLLTRSKMNYLCLSWAVYHSGFETSKLLYYFYRN